MSSEDLPFAPEQSEQSISSRQPIRWRPRALTESELEQWRAEARHELYLNSPLRRWALHVLWVIGQLVAQMEGHLRK